jgi:hypothetical protein
MQRMCSEEKILRFKVLIVERRVYEMVSEGEW